MYKRVQERERARVFIMRWFVPLGAVKVINSYSLPISPSIPTPSHPRRLHILSLCQDSFCNRTASATAAAAAAEERTMRIP